MEPLRAAVTVDAPPERAFEVFTEGLGRWWPQEFSWSQDVLQEIGIEPHEGGFAYERGPHGFTVHWGRVLTSEPPRRSPTPTRRARSRCASSRPTAAPPASRSSTGVGSATARARRSTATGSSSLAPWPYALERFAAAASS